MVAWEKYPQLLQRKTSAGSHNEWWAEWLAGRSISSTLKNVNINFNYLPYYLMSRDDYKIVAQVGSFGDKP